MDSQSSDSSEPESSTSSNTSSQSGSGLQPTQNVSSGQPSSSQPEQLDPTAYQVSGVNSEGFDGVVHLLVAWQPSDNGTPYADSWERFYGISDETMLYGRFEKWGSYPVEGSPTQDALDVAAGNPCYELLEQGILPLLEDVAGE
jgi:hypothetical protein